MCHLLVLFFFSYFLVFGWRTAVVLIITIMHKNSMVFTSTIRPNDQWLFSHLSPSLTLSLSLPCIYIYSINNGRNNFQNGIDPYACMRRVHECECSECSRCILYLYIFDNQRIYIYIHLYIYMNNT